MLEFKLSSWLFTAISLILLSFSSSEKVARDVLFPRILVLEDPGTRGPSSLANILIGNDPQEEYGLRSICQQDGLCSQKVRAGTGKWLGEGMNTAVINIRGRLRDDETSLSHAIDSTHLLIVEIDVSQETLDTSHLDNLRQLGSFMDVWKQTVIQLKNFDQSKSIRSKAEVLESYQTALKEEFHFEENLPGVCINIEALNPGDVNSYQSFLVETSRLSLIISIMAHKESMKHLSVVQSENDMLKDENKNLKAEVNQLDNDIASLQSRTKRLFQVDKNTCSVLDKYKEDIKFQNEEKEKIKQIIEDKTRDLEYKFEMEFRNQNEENKMIQQTLEVKTKNLENELQILDQKQRAERGQMESRMISRVDALKNPECRSYLTLNDRTRSASYNKREYVCDS